MVRLQDRWVYTEMSELEHSGFICPAYKGDLCYRGRQAQKVIYTGDNWEYRIRCSCGAIIIAIND
jgi:hypothetical protein